MSHRIPAALIIAAACLAFAISAASAEAPLVLKSSPPITGDAQAFPRLLGETPQATAINAALARGDARFRRFIGECSNLTAGGPPEAGPDVSRSVSAPMLGPAFLSLVAADGWYCGGPHPDTYQLALTYDLSTGRPITWRKYLPARLVQPEERDTADDGTIIGVVKSPALLALYRAKAKRERDDECGDVIADVDSLVLWIDAKADGVVLQPNGLSHAVAACGDSVVLTTAALRKLGASPKLIDAIDTAHRAHSWTDKF